VVARRHLTVGLLGRFRLGLAPARDRLECGTDIRHLLHPLADAREIGVGFDAAWSVEVERSWLVPVDAVGADDVVDEPALLLEPAHVRLAALVEYRLGLADHVHRILPLVAAEGPTRMLVNAAAGANDRHARLDYESTSSASAMPWPPPMHSVT